MAFGNYMQPYLPPAGPVYGAPAQPQMYQQPQMQTPMQPQMQPQQTAPLKGWPVAGEEDARNARIEVDGSVFVFPDIQNGKVYTKQISMADFSPIFKTYQLVEAPTAPAKQDIDLSGFVPRPDFEQLSGAYNQLAATVKGLQETIQQMTAGTGRKPPKEAEAK